MDQKVFLWANSIQRLEVVKLLVQHPNINLNVKDNAKTLLERELCLNVLIIDKKRGLSLKAIFFLQFNLNK